MSKQLDDEQLTMEDVMDFITLEAMAEMDSLGNEDQESEEVPEMISLLLEVLAGGADDAEGVISAAYEASQDANFEMTEEQVRSLFNDIQTNCIKHIDAMKYVIAATQLGDSAEDVLEAVRQQLSE